MQAEKGRLRARLFPRGMRMRLRTLCVIMVVWLAGVAAWAGESWEMSVVGETTLKNIDGTSRISKVNGTVTLKEQADGSFAGTGDMTATMVWDTPPRGGVIIENKLLPGSGKFSVKGKRDGKNLIFGIEKGSIVCKGTSKATYGETTVVTPVEPAVDPSVFTPAERTVIERKEGATASHKLDVTSAGAHVTVNADFTLSGGTGIVQEPALPKGKFPAKQDLWTLELDCDFTQEAHAGGADVTTDTSLLGAVEFPLPLADGEAKGTGPLSMQCSSVMTKPTPTKQKWSADGELILDGRIENDVLTFMPKGTFKNVTGTGASLHSAQNTSEGMWVLNPSLPVSMPVQDGAQVVQQLADPKTMITKGQLTWTLRGKKREVWRITLDGFDRISSGGNPQPIKKPKSNKDPNAPDVKWSDTACGLKVAWRVVIDVEIEDGKYKDGKCTAALISATPYSMPPGVYSVKATSVTIIDDDGTKHKTPYVRKPAFPVRKGLKFGKQLQLDLYFPNPDGDFGCWVAYRAVLNRKEAAKKIAFWNSNKDRLRPELSEKRFSYFPPRISVLLLDGWTKWDGDANSAQSEKYSVKRIE